MSLLTPFISNYPVMADGNIDYSDGNGYSVEIRQGQYNDGNRCVRHTLIGRNLVRYLIDEQQAKFACVVSAPWCSYRAVESIGNIISFTSEEIIFEQFLSSQSDHYGNPAMFQPIVISTQELKEFHLTEEHGVHQIWIDEIVDFPKGAKIAIGPFYRSASLVVSILQVRIDSSLPYGCFEVREDTEQGFYFRVNCSEDLFKSLKNPGKSISHRDSIYCFALSQGLGILKESYADEDKWSKYENLRFLYQHLSDIGADTWDQEGFSPNRSVAIWIPHKIDPMEDD